MTVPSMTEGEIEQVATALRVKFLTANWRDLDWRDMAITALSALKLSRSERAMALEEAAINYVQRVRDHGNLGEPWQALCDAVDRSLSEGGEEK